MYFVNMLTDLVEGRSGPDDLSAEEVGFALHCFHRIVIALEERDTRLLASQQEMLADSAKESESSGSLSQSQSPDDEEKDSGDEWVSVSIQDWN